MKNKSLAVFAVLALGMGISFAGNSTPQSASKPVEAPIGREVLSALNTEAALRTEPLAAQAARPYKVGFVRAGEEIVCAAAGKTAAGACWTVRLDQKTAQPLRISARGKVEAGDGQGEALLYVDVSYQDGDHLWGVKERFTPKPGDWTKRHVLLVPAKPIRVMAIYVMARGSATLRARFCPPTLERFDLTTVDATLFDNVPVAKRGTLDKPCLLVRDVQADSGFAPVVGTVKGARFETRREAAGGATFYDVSVADVQGGDRALTFVWAQPLAAGRLEYFASPRAAQDVTDAKGEFRDLVPVPCGAGGHSRWPFLAAAVDGKGVAIGLDPRRPGFSRVSLHAGLRILYAAFDVALAPEKKTARVGFVVFPFEAKDGFRGALEAYQRLFPEFNEVKQTKQGNWMAFRPISKVEGWEDFGFAIKEGDGETDWDDAHGITTYHYTEPTTWWMGIKGRDGREQATMAECVAEAERLAAEGKQRYARAWKACAFRDENGDYCGIIRDTPWCNGIAWNLNCAPGQGPDGEFEAKLGEAHFAKNYRGGFPEGLDGEYVDSSEMYVTAPIDFNRTNFAGMDTPLVFGTQNLKPGVFKGLMGYEYVREAWRKVRARGRRMMANATPGRWWWLAPYLDVMGTETNWLRDGKWQPSPDSALMYARALCGAKPYCFLMNTDFNAFTGKWVDKYMQRALAYGMYPSFFSPQATSKSHYFSTPAYYNRDRALFKKYMPLCIRVGEAGWRPVNRLLASDAPQVITEQFGDRYATIYNLATNTVQATLTSLSGATTARELVGGGEWRFANGRYVVQIPGETVFVLEFPSPSADAPKKQTAEVKVDWSAVLGPVKPVNGVGQPPLVGKLATYPMFRYLKEAGIPYSRLHDVSGWLGGGLFVDIPNLFPNFAADENDAANYRFAYTDSLMKALVKNGVEPFFRLGVTIENFVAYPEKLPPVNILPPPDFAKWARICEHVIRHYTEGWADGFKMKITYWEIWNEPENHPDDDKNPMFRAPFSEYMRLYGVAAPYLKAKFPHLKIGGYGHCGFYAGVGSDHVPAANSSPRMQYFVECSHKFLAAARDNGWPLDFFSYHSYSAPKEALRQVRFADEHLNEYGFTADKCERIFNEWLPYVKHENLGSALQAAGVAAELIGLQNGPCDVACIYDARCGVGNYSPLFNPLTYKPHKAYYAFTAFNELRRCGTAVKAVVTGCPDLWVAAAKGKKGGAVLLANDSDATLPLACDFQGREVVSCRITDAERTDCAIPLPTSLPPRSFAVVLLR